MRSEKPNYLITGFYLILVFIRIKVQLETGWRKYHVGTSMRQVIMWASVCMLVFKQSSYSHHMHVSHYLWATVRDPSPFCLLLSSSPAFAFFVLFSISFNMFSSYSFYYTHSLSLNLFLFLSLFSLSCSTSNLYFHTVSLKQVTLLMYQYQWLIAHRWIAIMLFFLHLHCNWISFLLRQIQQLIVSPHKRNMASKTEKKNKSFVLSVIGAEKTLEDT